MNHQRIMGLPTRTASEIQSILEARELEDLETLETLDGLLRARRGHVFQMPPPGTPVILQLSGGMDSLTTALLLVETLELEVWPLFLRRGQDRVAREEEAADHVVAWIRERYPSRFHPPFKADVRVPPRAFRSGLIPKASHPLGPDTRQARGIPMYASMLTSYAVQFGYWLEATQGVVARDIFCGAQESDGWLMAHHTLTGMRVTLVNACVQTRDFRWQLASPWMEPALGTFWGKEVILAWANQRRIPIHHTWSCYGHEAQHCGTCPGCELRRNAFRDAGIADLTGYACFAG